MNKYDKNKLAERIFELRTEKGLSQQALAFELGVSQKAIDFWEKGTNEPKASYVYKLSNFFNVPSDYLLGIIDEY